MGHVTSEEVKILRRFPGGGGTEFLHRRIGNIERDKQRDGVKVILGRMKPYSLTLRSSIIYPLQRHGSKV